MKYRIRLAGVMIGLSAIIPAVVYATCWALVIQRGMGSFGPVDRMITTSPATPAVIIAALAVGFVCYRWRFS